MGIIERFLELFRTLSLSISNFSNIGSLSGAGLGWLFGALGSVILSIYGLSLGKTKAVLSLFAIYIAFAFNRTFPYLDFITDRVGNFIPAYLVEASLFLLVYVVVFSILNFSFIHRRLSSSEFSIFGVLIVSFFQLGLILSIILHSLPITIAQEYSFGSYDYFGTNQALFVWIVVPMLALPFLREK